jgi:uncharacterized protein YyaL (SSP411 family)
VNDTKRVNRLSRARSPYLLQHAENPVDWYEWGPEAFETAHAENRPVFLSIGYATCHWCHVMAHECFQDQDVANLLNRNFVCIKVDREERPDIDDFFMTATQLMGSRGGWPLNIFMTPQKLPFLSITYLPKLGNGGMTGFMDLTANIAVLWRQRPDLIDQNCRAVMDELGTLAGPKQHANVALAELSRSAFDQLSGIYDREFGGFGTAPKFPMPTYLSWLIEQGRGGNRQALAMALHTLARIRGGGIWDHLGGGLHRYSTDREWLAPHFEKMLYDQALLAMASLDAWQAADDDRFLAMAEEILSFAEQELLSPEGAYCAALDADSEGVEGKFYLWDTGEIEECLGPDADLFCRFHAVRPEGNFEGHTILIAPEGVTEFCARERLDPAVTAQNLERSRLLLLKRRGERAHPFRDAKILTAWNGLMIAALARAGVLGGKRAYLERAERTAAFCLGSLRRGDGRLLRSYLGGASNVPAFLEDYAYLCFGLLELFEATLDNAWLDAALGLADDSLRLFRRPADGCFATIGSDAEQMPAQVTLDHDGVTPSAASLLAQVLIRLGRAAGRPDLAEAARTALADPLAKAQAQPLVHLGALRALALLETEPVVVTFFGALKEREQADLLAVVLRHTFGNRVIKRAPSTTGPAGVQVCGAGACHPPILDTVELAELLGRL